MTRKLTVTPRLPGTSGWPVVLRDDAGVVTVGLAVRSYRELQSLASTMSAEIALSRAARYQMTRAGVGPP